MNTRFAVPGDEQIILGFIRALAEYENMSEQVVATPNLLREWILKNEKNDYCCVGWSGKSSKRLRLCFLGIS